jgi:hypothetical protein
MLRSHIIFIRLRPTKMMRLRLCNNVCEIGKYLHGREWGSHHIVVVVVHGRTAHRSHRCLHAVAEICVDYV